MQSIKTKAVRIKVSVSKLGGYVRDDALNSGLESTYNTVNRSIVHKKIFKNSPKFRQVQSSFTNIYQYYKDNSLPWEDGSRIIPSTEVLPTSLKLSELKDICNQKLEDFLSNYDAEVAKDIQESGGMMKLEDYPSPTALRTKYNVSVKFMPLSEAEDFRVVEGMDQTDVENLIEEAKDEVNKQTVEMAKDTWGRLYKVVNHLKERLSAYKGEEGDRLHKSLFSNVSDTITILRKLNKVVGDESLNDVMDELERDLGDVDIERVKALPATRNETIKKVSDLVSKMPWFNQQQEQTQ